MTPEQTTQSAVLVVDLDGTLCKTDTMHEALLALLANSPAKLFEVPFWLAEGRVGFKANLADHEVVDVDKLPLNDVVVDTVRAAREAGVRTALVSASDHRQVTAVAEHTGLFDEAYGSAEGRNLKGEAKAAFLTEHFGAGAFDYIGNSRADLPVWAAAKSGVTVAASQNLRRAAEAENSTIRHIDPPRSKLGAIARALRPHQWSKNLLLFLPVLAAHDVGQILTVVLAFVAFCLTASAVYVINDLLDLASDRAHPRKRLRPFAAGELTAVEGVVLSGTLLMAAVISGSLSGKLGFMAVLGLYLLMTFLYSLWLKRKLIVDVLMLAGLYTVRIVAGGAAATVELSPWLLGFSIFVFLSLAAVKRQAELTDQFLSGRASSGRAYEVEDLPILRGIALSSAHASVLVFALYINSDEVQRLYSQPQLLWLICPLLLYWTLRMIMKSHRGTMTDDPIVFAAKDIVSILIVILCVSVAVASI